jgi:predicted DNA-binding transcriptional regulator AlpA
VNRDELLALPATVDLVTAARALGIGRTTAYQLARAGEFPIPVLRLGARYRVVTSGLLAALGIEPAGTGTAAPGSQAPAPLRPVPALRI